MCVHEADACRSGLSDSATSTSGAGLADRALLFGQCSIILQYIATYYNSVRNRYVHRTKILFVRVTSHCDSGPLGPCSTMFIREQKREGQCIFVPLQRHV